MNSTQEKIYDITQDLENLVYVVRDCNLPDFIAAKYKPGMIIREKGFCDATYIVGGMTTTHRFTILSNQFYDLSSFDENKQGLCTTNKDARFKVLDVFSVDGKTQITLLELPRDNRWKNYQQVTYIVEKRITNDARQRFLNLIKADPMPEQNTPEMLSRFSFPIGLNDDGTIFPLE